MTIGESFRQMNDWFFDLYVRAMPWFAQHKKCPTCDARGATKACYISFMKSLPGAP